MLVCFMFVGCCCCFIVGVDRLCLKMLELADSRGNIIDTRVGGGLNPGFGVLDWNL